MSKKIREELKKNLDTLIEEHSTEMEREAMKLPGMNSSVMHPVIGRNAPLWLVVTNLNDHHGWSRDQIADWLDRIQDAGRVNLAFDHKEKI